VTRDTAQTGGMTASVFVSVGIMPATDFLEQNTTLHSWSVCSACFIL